LADCPQQHGHGERAGEAEEQEREDGIDVMPQAGHEIQWQVEGKGRQNLGGEVANGGRDGFGEGTVESVAGVLLNDGALGVETEDLESAVEAVEEDGKVDENTARVDGGGIVRQVEEDAAEEEGDDEVAANGDEEEELVAHEALVATGHAEKDLHGKGDGVG
jgi:hypothetical protein